MAFPFIPVVVGLGVTGWAWKRSRRGKKLSDEHKRAYQTALAETADPSKLRALADVLQKDGHRHEAAELRKRAEVHETPPEVKKKYRDVRNRALKNTDPDKVRDVAKGF